MAGPTKRESTLGILIYLVLGAALGAAVLIAMLTLGLDAVADIYGAELAWRIDSLDAQTFVLLGFFTFAPALAILVAMFLGLRAARTGAAVGGTAAATTMYGIPLLWVNMAIAFLLSSAILDGVDGGSIFGGVADLLIESIVFLLLETFATIGFAALAATMIKDAFRIEGAPAPAYATAPPEPRYEAVPVSPQAYDEALAEVEEAPRTDEPDQAEAAPPPASYGNRLDDFPVDCPRCHTEFKVSGERPVRIVCPACGKTGTIR